MTDNKNHSLVKNEILNIKVTNVSASQILEYVVWSLSTNITPYYIVTPNPEMVVRAQKDSQFKEILNHAEISLCDGTGLLLGSLILGKPLKERITGVSFMQEICKAVADRPVTIGLLGGRNNVAVETAKRLQRTYPGLKIGFVGEELQKGEWRKENGEKRNNQERNNLLSPISILETPIDILFVAFGAPKQEMWMREHVGKIPVKVMMGVGGAFDEISGKVDLCPLWIDMLGFKWLWRLVHEPWRWRRQLALIAFVKLVMQEKFGKK